MGVSLLTIPNWLIAIAKSNNWKYEDLVNTELLDECLTHTEKVNYLLANDVEVVTIFMGARYPKLKCLFNRTPKLSVHTDTLLYHKKQVLEDNIKLQVALLGDVVSDESGTPLSAGLFEITINGEQVYALTPKPVSSNCIEDDRSKLLHSIAEDMYRKNPVVNYMQSYGFIC